MLARNATLALCAMLPCIAAAQPPETPDRSGPYAVEILDARGAALPTFHERGRTYVLGTIGERYVVRVRNGSDRRAEVVVSVDGRDVVDGAPASWSKRGYVVGPRSAVDVDGFRLSERSVAAFRFSSVSRSYASRMGDARDVGVIGVAVFPERPRLALAPPPWQPPRPEYGDLSRDRSAPEARAGQGEAAGGSAASPPAPEAAPGAPSGSAARGPALGRAERSERPGLGTEFGEEHGSPVEQVAFERESARPAVVLAVRYDDREGLLAAGVDVDGRRWERDEAWRRATASPFRAEPGFSEPPPGWSGR